MTNTTLTDHELAAAVASEAGAMLMALPEALRNEADTRSQELILDMLSEARPRDALLAEEGFDDPARLSAPRVWIVDPLDGTREYREGGRTDWAVHVALWSEGKLVAGAVALPAQGKTFATGEPASPPAGAFSGVLVVSRTRPPAVVEKLAATFGLELRGMGSAGAKAMAVVTGEADAYVHAGGQYEWDSAAPAVVAKWHGLHVSRLDGSPLRYNQPDVYLPDLVVCRPEVAERLLDEIAEEAAGADGDADG